MILTIVFKNNNLLFLGNFVKGQGCDGRRQSYDRGIPSVPLLGKNMDFEITFLIVWTTFGF